MAYLQVVLVRSIKLILFVIAIKLSFTSSHIDKSPLLKPTILKKSTVLLLMELLIKGTMTVDIIFLILSVYSGQSLIIILAYFLLCILLLAIYSVFRFMASSILT